MKETKFTVGSSPVKRAAAKKAWETWSAMRARAPKKASARQRSGYGSGRNPSSWRNSPRQKDWQIIIKTPEGWMLPEQSRRALVTRRQLQLLESMSRYDRIDRKAIAQIANSMGVLYKSAYDLMQQISAKFDGATSAQLLELGKQLSRNRVSARGRAEPVRGNR